MKASIYYRIAAVLLVLFAAGHTLGFTPSDPKWGVESLLASMRSIHFEIQGFQRSYWDFFLADGYSVGILFLFAALLAWQLGGLPPEMQRRLRGTAWAFTLCFALIIALSLKYLFIVPIILSTLITVCLMTAALLSSKQSS